MKENQTPALLIVQNLTIEEGSFSIWIQTIVSIHFSLFLGFHATILKPYLNLQVKTLISILNLQFNLPILKPVIELHIGLLFKSSKNEFLLKNIRFPCY